jgi:uncharacterized phage protein (predicted DNA packaging)
MLEEVKQYLRIDGSEDDSFLASRISGAKEYIKNATDIEMDENNDLHREVVCYVVYIRYENIPFNEYQQTLRSYLEQIKYSYGDVV